MTDKELLELAAKAAGIEELGYEMIEFCGIRVWARNGDSACIWNPLADDGDALRLAAKTARMSNAAAMAMCKALNEALMCDYESREHTNALLRRSIVRAVVEIWKASSNV